MKKFLSRIKDDQKPISILICLICLCVLAWANVVVNQRFLQSGESFVIWNVTPFFVSYGFFLVGVITLIKGYQYPIVSFFFLVAATLSVGFISEDEDFGARLFLFFFAWCAPALISFHITWLGLSVSRFWKTIYLFIQLTAGILSIPFLIFDPLILQHLRWFDFLDVAVRILFIFSLFILLIMLSRQYKKTSSRTIRAKIRLLLLGTVLGTVPVVLLSMLPNVLNMSYVPYEVSFPFLLFIPLIYGYSIFRSNLSSFENRITQWILVYITSILALDFYWISSRLLGILFPQWKNSWANTTAFIMGLFILLLFPFRSILNHFIYWAFNGEETSTVLTISEVSHLLFHTRSVEALIDLLVKDLPDHLNWSGGALFLKEKNGRLYLHKRGWLLNAVPDMNELSFDVSSKIVKKLEEHSGLLDNSTLSHQLMKQLLSDPERTALRIGEKGIWLLLRTSEDIEGILVLGPRNIQEDIFTANDYQVLKVFALLAAVAIQQTHILEEVSASRNELAKSHLQILAAREGERFSLARELHDQVIQQLIGISYQIQQIQKETRSNIPLSQAPAHLHQVRQGILNVVSTIRNIIQDIRPVGLEVFGFVNTIDQHIISLQKQSQGSPEIILIKGDVNEPFMSDQLRINLFRIVQEALRNAIKHAEAAHVTIKVQFCEGELHLNIQDDGHGFDVPERISEFAQNGCFGLIGLTERVMGLQGEINIISKRAKGTIISAIIPIPRISQTEQLVGSYVNSGKPGL